MTLITLSNTRIHVYGALTSTIVGPDTSVYTPVLARSDTVRTPILGKPCFPEAVFDICGYVHIGLVRKRGMSLP